MLSWTRIGRMPTLEQYHNDEASILPASAPHRRLTSGFNFGRSDPRTVQHKMQTMQLATSHPGLPESSQTPNYTTQPRDGFPAVGKTTDHLNLVASAQPQPQTAPLLTLPTTTTTTTTTRHILALGGSTTWGSKLSDRHQAYPYRLATLLGPEWKTINMAVRASDATYASQCIETMFRTHPEATTTSLGTVDVILMEFSVNGIEGMGLLLQRLKRRFPQAVVLYVHLYSLRMNVDNAVTGEKPRQVLHETNVKFVDADARINAMLNDAQAVWKWSEAMMGDAETVRIHAMDLLRQKTDNDHIALYALPVPDSPRDMFGWFGPDYHHLGVHGHYQVALELHKLYRKTLSSSSSLSSSLSSSSSLSLQNTKWDGTWGQGDLCHSWYETGQEPSGVTMRGGTLKMFVKPNKWALHIGLRFGQPATIVFPSSSSSSSQKTTTAQPIQLVYMSWGPNVYPKCSVTLNAPPPQSETQQQQQQQQAQVTILDPLHPNPSKHVFHVTRSTLVGWTQPGRTINTLTINPLEDKERPLRVIGIIQCGACVEMDPNYI